MLPIANPELPLLRYASLLGTHSVLLLFSAFYLPRNNLLSPYTAFSPAAPKPNQHYLVAPLTASPQKTLVWTCAGTAVLACWWAGYMRAWVSGKHVAPPGKNEKSSDEAEKKKLAGDKFKVRHLSRTTPTPTRFLFCK